MRRDRFIVVSNDDKHLYRIQDTVTHQFLRRFHYRADAIRIVGAGNVEYSRTGVVTWPWANEVMSPPRERALVS